MIEDGLAFQGDLIQLMLFDDRLDRFRLDRVHLGQILAAFFNGRLVLAGPGMMSEYKNHSCN